jgi:hypothetical protein
LSQPLAQPFQPFGVGSELLAHDFRALLGLTVHLS